MSGFSELFKLLGRSDWESAMAGDVAMNPALAGGGGFLSWLPKYNQMMSQYALDNAETP